jgi:N-formylglutamate deformylase
MHTYTLIKPHIDRVPVIISAPHVGTDFPDDLKPLFHDSVVKHPVDTDWLVHKLYDFAPSLGITLIHARFSRYVIDLNRDPQNTKLYEDARKETGLIPRTTFEGEPLYKKAAAYERINVQERLDQYYWPYYRAIENEISDLKQSFRNVILYDAHSITRVVKTIADKPFPDLILGDNDEKSADKTLIDTALAALSSGPYKVMHNTPFKGGHITRYFGNPANGVHALQVERSQDIYLTDENEIGLEPAKLAQLQPLLQKCMIALINAVGALNDKA